MTTRACRPHEQLDEETEIARRTAETNWKASWPKLKAFLTWVQAVKAKTKRRSKRRGKGA